MRITKKQFGFLFALLLLLFGNQILSAQVIINESSSVASLINSYQSVNEAETMVKGWRIQIITTSDRREMEAARTKFRRLFPEIKSTWIHENPYYKVKVGAYRNKIELQSLLRQLKNKFRGVIPVVEKIKKKDLLT